MPWRGHRNDGVIRPLRGNFLSVLSRLILGVVQENAQEGELK